MTITTIAGFDQSIATADRFAMQKTNIANTLAGGYFSYWTQTGVPAAGATPTTTAVCNRTTTGGIPYTESTGSEVNYITEIDYSNRTVGNSTLEYHDRLAHMGGLNATLTTAQTVSLDLSTLLTTNNLDARKGDANYSDVQWWMEWYADTGATASNATVNVTYNDASSGNLTVIAVGGTVRARRMIPLNSLIPAADSGKFIRAINNVTLSASTGAAGNFGFTATRYRAGIAGELLTRRYKSNWEYLGFPEIVRESCLFQVTLTSSTASGDTTSVLKIAKG